MKYFLISFLILVLGFFGFLNPLKDAFQLVFTPVELGLSDMGKGIKKSFEFYGDLRSIRDENIKLLSQIENLKAIILDIKVSADENKILKDQLELKNKDSFDKTLVMANVLGNKDDISGTTVILDKGTRHGAKVGSNVIRGRFLVGLVSQVTSEKSVVNLITSPKLLAAVYDIDSPQKSAGLAQGDYGSSVVMTRILPTDDVRVGDTIVTSGKDGLFIPGLIVGVVGRLVENTSEPLKSAYLDLSISLNDLDKVFVIYE